MSKLHQDPRSGAIQDAVIVNAYSYRNAGDAAIMLSTADLLDSLGVETVSLSTRYDEDTGSYARYGIDVVPAVVAFPSRGQMNNSLRTLVFICGSLWALLVARTLGSAVKKRRRCARGAVGRLAPRLKVLVGADLAVIAGGGYLYSSRRGVNFSLLHSCVTARLCTMLAPATVMMPCSIGPVHRRFDARVIEWGLRDVPIVVREELSLNRSTRMLSLRDYRVVPDVAFWGVSGVSDQLDVGRAPLTARLVALDWRWSSSVDSSRYDHYLSEMAALCDLLSESGFEVVLGGHSILPEHGQDDLQACEEIARRTANGEVAIDRDADVGHLWRAYAEVSVVVGTRLHACIMAIAAGTPAVSLGYQEKAEGIAAIAGDRIAYHRADAMDASEVGADAIRLAGLSANQTRNRLRAEIAEAYRAMLDVRG